MQHVNIEQREKIELIRQLIDELDAENIRLIKNDGYTHFINLDARDKAQYPHHDVTLDEYFVCYL